MWNIFDSLTKTKAKKLMYTSLLSFLSWKSFYNIGIQVMEFLRSWIHEYIYIYIYIYIYHIYIYIYIYHIYIYIPTLYSNGPRISAKDAFSCATWTQLTHKYWKQFRNFWKTHFFLGIRLIVTKQIHIFLTLL